MNISTRLILSIFLLLAVSYWPLAANAEIPHLINYQAKLTDTDSNPLEGSYDITFRIYDDETAGELLWEEAQVGVVIQKGVFSTMLGSVTELNLAFDAPYWLAIKIGADSEMTPRQQIASSAYTFNAQTAEAAEKIKASSADATADYLSDTADNVTLEVGMASQELQIKDAGVSYVKIDDDTHERLIKAWVNFNGRGTIYIRDSYNVASIVDNKTGYFTVNWDIDFADANYSVHATAGRPETTTADSNCSIVELMTKSAVQFNIRNGANQRVNDPSVMCVLAIGDQ